ncbi:hypothetical protein J2S08_003965 [Bacillus chungangensis]|uniref:Uncharacterized protein n=1 Tax=Bacillus chungangensis TaxID=587633 RepID=A0ABT9WXP8_9BACI|nr:hypothetical protein [Bacillus chungangensis]
MTSSDLGNLSGLHDYSLDAVILLRNQVIICVTDCIKGDKYL